MHAENNVREEWANVTHGDTSLASLTEHQRAFIDIYQLAGTLCVCIDYMLYPLSLLNFCFEE